MDSPKNFPEMKNDLILRAARGEKTERVPVWVMRQAGRYLPEFQELRKRHSFFEVCKTPSLACEVTLQPLRRFSLDAAIIFSDILVVPQALGMIVDMRAGVGPVLPNPIRKPDDLSRLKVPCNVDVELDYVFKALTYTRHKLDGIVPLIGFAGAPWTLMCYMVEGGGSRTMSNAKGWLYRWPSESHKLLRLLTDILVDYLVGQVKGGAQLLQVFESTAEYLGPNLFDEFALPYIKEIKQRVTTSLADQDIPNVPMIIFAKGSCIIIDQLINSGYDVVSVDWTIKPSVARAKAKGLASLQGNLDPCALKAKPDDIHKMVKSMLEEFGTQKYIANLGHGIYPDINPDSVKVFVKSIREVSECMNDNSSG